MVVIYTVSPTLAAVDGESRVLRVAAVDSIAADEVGHGILPCRAELHLGALGRLEKNVAVTVCIKLTRGVRSRTHEVATRLVHSRDGLNGVGPVLLHLENLLLRDGGGLKQRRGRRGSRLERDRRMVEEDTHLAVGTTLVAEGVLNSGHRASGGAGKVVITHRNPDTILDLDFVVHVLNIRPPIAAIDRETSVLLVAILHIGISHEVGHSIVRSGTKLLLSALGGLEEHIAVTITVKLASCLAGGADKVTARLMDCGDVFDSICPLVLHLKNFSLSHRWRGESTERHGRVVEEDAQLAVIVLLVTEGVLDLDLAVVRGVGEVVVAHSYGAITKDLNLVVVEHNIRPALATVNGETGVLLVAAINCIVADEVRHGLIGGRAELVRGALGRFEEDRRAAIAIELIRSICSRLNVVTAVEIRPADRLDSVGPSRLRGAHLGLGH
mmetsp:Transcript_3612/g.5408  ORF Transcript_3612/g.5408 Transcript_3612/m.5408 type:complete len:441 (-) Transcript_3612:262-1584(-)